MGFGGGFSAAVIGVGYIVGFPAVISMLLGGLLAWIIGVPLYGIWEGLPAAQSAHDAAMRSSPSEEWERKKRRMWKTNALLLTVRTDSIR